MFRLYLVLVCSSWLISCGSANRQSGAGEAASGDDLEVELTAEDFAPRTVLTRGDLTTAVDHKRYRAAAPVASEFLVSEKVIYLVGRLKNVPTESTIEVRWFLDAEPEPMLISEIQGSDRYQFVASFQPTEKRFIRGTYTARVYVNDEEVGAVPFALEYKDGPPERTVVREVKISKKVNRKARAIKPASHFKRGTKKLFVSFDVKDAEYGTVAGVQWSRGEEAFHNEVVELSGNKRYSAHISADDGLPSGEYMVEIAIGGEVAAAKKFVVGQKTNGPTIDEIALGMELGGDNMPVEEMSSFRSDTQAIQCGLRFVDLLPNTVLELQWFSVEDDEETLLYRNQSALASGGTGTMGAAWEPKYALAKGSYKVVVLVNQEPLAEKPFKVK